MIRIVADNFVKAECREEFLKMAAQLAEGTRAEAGNISYVLHQDMDDANHFTFIEEWQDKAAIESHNASKHFTTLVPKMHDCASKPGTCYLYEPII